MIRLVNYINTNILVVGNKRFSILKLSEELDWGDIRKQERVLFEESPSVYNLGERDLWLGVFSTEEFDEIHRELDLWGFRVLSQIKITQEEGPRVWRDPKNLNEQDINEISNFDSKHSLGIRLYKKDLPKFMDFLRALSRILNYKVLYRDTLKSVYDISPDFFILR